MCKCIYVPSVHLFKNKNKKVSNWYFKCAYVNRKCSNWLLLSTADSRSWSLLLYLERNYFWKNCPMNCYLLPPPTHRGVGGGDWNLSIKYPARREMTSDCNIVYLFPFYRKIWCNFFYLLLIMSSNVIQYMCYTKWIFETW